MPVLREWLAGAALVALCAAPVLAVGLATARGRRPGAAVLFLALLLADSLVVSAPSAWGVALLPGASWNWTGKAASVLLMAGVVAAGVVSPEAAGLTVRQRAGSATPAALVTAALVALGAAIGWAFGGGGPLRPEALTYQLTAPGVAEEIAFRGVLLALAHRAFAEPDGDLSSWRTALATTLAFAFTHTPTLVDGAVAFEPLPFLLPLVGGVALWWLRERTGSLVWPILAHNGLNAAIVVAGAVA